MDEQYEIYFAGQLVEGFEEEAVRSNMAVLFKAKEAMLDKLFSGKHVPIKRGVDQQTAARYQAAMLKAGAVAIVKQLATPATAPDNQDLPSSQEIPNAALAIAPVGSEILRDEERPDEAVTDVDISGIALVSAFLEPEAVSTPPPPAPDTSHISLAESEGDIPHVETDQVPINPDLSHLSVAEAGEDIPNLPGDEVPLNPDTSTLSVAETGSDVLAEEFRTRETAVAPDTAHIQLQDDEPG